MKGSLEDRSSFSILTFKRKTIISVNTIIYLLNHRTIFCIVLFCSIMYSISFPKRGVYSKCCLVEAVFICILILFIGFPL